MMPDPDEWIPNGPVMTTLGTVTMTSVGLSPTE